MILKTYIPKRYFSIPDLIILLLVVSAIYGLYVISHAWRAEFQPVTEIDLSPRALPYYTLLSGIRGLAAYLISLSFTLIVGYSAAKWKTAESILIPLLDIGQSIPVLGFLPGLVLGLIAIFPNTNMGLELAAILTIFTGQVWNMTFAFYSSLKSIPPNFIEASEVMGLSLKQRLLHLELPFSATNLAWNSLMSMAGGWFFLTVCESFNLGDRKFQLPGLGAYMQVAINASNHRAILLGIIAMIGLIVTMDFFLWRPILAWVQKFRVEDVPGMQPVEPLIQVVIRQSRIIRWVGVLLRRYQFEHRRKVLSDSATKLASSLESTPFIRSIVKKDRRQFWSRPQFFRVFELLMGIVITSFLLAWAWKLLNVLFLVSVQTWIILMRDTVWTFLRVLSALLISTLWAVPVGIWIGTSAKRVRIAQPLIQVLASFPAPMIYPLVLTLLFWLGIDFSIGSMVLIMLGVQWYVLFNVLAGALRIPRELEYMLELMNTSRWVKWKVLYLPSVFPALVTGWVTGAGGGWNASIVAEVMSYYGRSLRTGGLGAAISYAADSNDFHLLAASLTVMVCVVLILNRTLWARIYELAETRFRMDI